MDDVGKPNILISTKIAHDYPNSDGTPKKVGDTLLIGGKPFHGDRHLRDGLALDRHDHRDGDHRPRASS